MSGRFSTVTPVLWVLTAALVCGNCPGRAEQAPAKKATRAISPEVAIRQALAKPVELKFVETPLADVAKWLEKTLGVQVRFDRKALKDVGIAADAPVTFQVSGISARSALELILRQLDLTWVIAHEMLLITTPEEAETRLVTKVYDVEDLVFRCQQVGDTEYRGSCCDFDSLTDVITATIQPTSWDCVGGPGSIAPFEAAGIIAIVFSQTQEVHEEVEALLADIRNARREKPGPGAAAEKRNRRKRVSPERQQGPQRREEAIRRALVKPVNLEFTETPLADVVESLKEKAGIPVIIDHRALDDIGVDGGAPITIQVSDIKLRSALDFMLRPLDLSWTIAHEVLLITTPEEAENMLRTKVYDVSDLPAYRDRQGEGVPDFQSMMETTAGCVEPTSWDSVGGPGSIAPYDAPGIKVLVVSQTREAHEEVEALLEKLRKVRGKGPGKEKISKLPPEPPPRDSRRDFRPPQEYAVSAPIAEPPVYPDPAPVKPAPLKEHPDRDAVVKGNNQFGFDLYAKLPQGAHQNLFFSPSSISTALAMAYAGARGKTAEEMAQTLHFTLPPQDLHPAFHSLLEALAGTSRPGCELSVANRLWGQEGYGFLAEFLALTRNHYGGELVQVNFQQPEAARQIINAWIEAQTRQRIQNAIGPGVLNSYTRLVLTNAIYFKGKWASPFRMDATHPAPFRTGDQKVNVMMMYQRDNCRYGTEGDLQILEKSYGGGDLSMMILLPKWRAGAFAELESALSAEKVSAWASRLAPRQVDVYLPKFKLETGYRLVDVLARMGMPRAFSPAEADLSGMNGGKEPLWLQAVIHRAYVSVDEEGTEAAAATAVGGFGGMSMRPPPIPVFRADRAFVFLIRENRTGSILFLGRLVQPPEASGTPSRKPGRGFF